MRSKLPSGTVTFLFTDVEGSTRLLHELGAERYAEALAEHRRIVREACAAHDGVEVDTQGDAFFVAFPTAPGALAAARAITERLAESLIRLRIGLHTGTPLVTDEGYVGADVHRAARIAAAGHGGQVLISASTSMLLEVELRDLGEHRFKDLAAAERVYQHGGEDFPALKSLYRTNLPVPATTFLGRERELAEVVELLGRDDVRLLTLTGPGGTGKTRLALQAAAEASDGYPDGLFWVPLAPLRDPTLLLHAVAQALDVTEEPGADLAETLKAAIADKESLVLLDNLEHLLPHAASELAQLASAAGPAFLVTSRERLQLQSEQLYPVPTLDQSDAVGLFLARARALAPEFRGNGAIPELCLRLDNLPLALELAAARTTLFSPEQLLERLSQRLDLLKGARDADPRQQTLRATIEWSYELLDQEERRLLRSLSVFAGGSTYEAAEEVCDANPETLQSLLDKSLVSRRDSEVGPRYWMLETIREFAAERLEGSGEEPDVRERHFTRFLELVTEAVTALNGPSRSEWLGRLEDDLPNIRAALSWTEQSEDGDRMARLATPIFRFWGPSGRYAEERRWYVCALDLGIHDATLRAHTVGRLGNVDYRQGRYAEALARGEEHLETIRSFDDNDELFYALSWCANAHFSVRQSERASELYEEAIALARGLNDIWKLAYGLGNLGDMALVERDFARAAALSAECAALARQAGDASLEVVGLLNSGTAAFHLERPEDARAHVAEAIRLAQNAHVSMLGNGFELLAAIAARYGDEWRAATLLGAADAIRNQSGDTLEPTEQALREETSLALGGLEGAFADAWRHGGELTLDEAVAYALEEASDA